MSIRPFNANEFERSLESWGQQENIPYEAERITNNIAASFSHAFIKCRENSVYFGITTTRREDSKLVYLGQNTVEWNGFGSTPPPPGTFGVHREIKDFLYVSVLWDGIVRREIRHCLKAEIGNCTDESWKKVEKKFFAFLKNHCIAAGVIEEFRGCDHEGSFDPDIGGRDNLRILKFVLPFEKFSCIYPVLTSHRQNSANLISAAPLLKQAQEHRFTDCTIKFQDNSTWGGHRGVLASCSNVFNTMFSSSMKEGGSQREVCLNADSKTAQIFIAFLYTSKNPFENNEGEIDIDDLLSLSHMFEIKPLFDHCATYLGTSSKSAQISNKDLQALEVWGIKYENKHLLELYQYHSWHQGKLISEKAKEIFSKLHIEDYKPKTAELSVQCDVGFGNTVGIRYQDCDSLPYVDFSWKITQGLTWSPSGWMGCVPINTPFKFFKVLEDGETAVCENREVVRSIECPQTGASIRIDDVFFG